MTTRTISRALAVASLGSLVAAGIQWQRVPNAGSPDRGGVASLRPVGPPVPTNSLADAADAIVTNDAFRLSNSPPSTRYDPTADGAPAGSVAAIPQPRPSLVLKAIVGGPPWQAVIDGIPGQSPGTLARAGNKFDRLTVRAVTRDSVIVQGADTTWVLSFRAR